MLVEITIKRDDGTVVIKAGGNAFGQIEWRAPLDNGLIDMQASKVLQGFVFISDFTYLDVGEIEYETRD
jgi:hypothetical protein